MGKILEKGRYLQVEMLCRSDVTGTEYPATMVFPMDMADLDGLRRALESKVQSGGLIQKKEYSEPGLLRIQSIEPDDDKGAVVSGRMLEGTIARATMSATPTRTTRPSSRAGRPHLPGGPGDRLGHPRGGRQRSHL